MNTPSMATMLADKQTEHRNALELLLTVAETENRALTPAESEQVDTLTKQIKQVAERAASNAKTAETRAMLTQHGGAIVRSEPRTYSEQSNRDGVTYFGDLIKRQMMNDGGAHERLAQHRQEVLRETRDISRVDGAGGEFVPPTWLMDSYAEFARAPRTVARLMTNQPMPSGTDSINIPRITTGPQTAVQTADNAAVQETDMVTSSVSAPVRTIAGQQDVALQLIDQSPAAFDQIVFAELLADYERSLDLQLISGTGASGQLQGLLGLSGITAITYTQASPTVPLVYAPLHQAVAGVLAARQLPPDAAVTNGRWWSWAAASLDSSNRPLVVPTSAGPNNAFGSTTAPTNGAVGSLGVVPFYATTNVPVNLGAGTNETRIIVGRFSDSMLFESELRTRVLPDVGSGTLTVRLQAYRYAAVAHRFPASYAVISGTGMVLAANY